MKEKYQEDFTSNVINDDLDEKIYSRRNISTFPEVNFLDERLTEKRQEDVLSSVITDSDMNHIRENISENTPIQVEAEIETDTPIIDWTTPVGKFCPLKLLRELLKLWVGETCLLGVVVLMNMGILSDCIFNFLTFSYYEEMVGQSTNETIIILLI